MGRRSVRGRKAVGQAAGRHCRGPRLRSAIRPLPAVRIALAQRRRRPRGGGRRTGAAARPEPSVQRRESVRPPRCTRPSWSGRYRGRRGARPVRRADSPPPRTHRRVSWPPAEIAVSFTSASVIRTAWLVVGPSKNTTSPAWNSRGSPSDKSCPAVRGAQPAEEAAATIKGAHGSPAPQRLDDRRHGRQDSGERHQRPRDDRSRGPAELDHHEPR